MTDWIALGESRNKPLLKVLGAGEATTVLHDTAVVAVGGGITPACL